MVIRARPAHRDLAAPPEQQAPPGPAFSNQWNVEGPLSSGTTISDSDVHRTVLVNNSSPATITLPHANSAAGKLILFQASSNYTGTNPFTIQVQVGDHILNHNSANLTGQATTCTVTSTAEFVSDGTSLWYLTRLVDITSNASSCDSQ